MTTIPDTTTNSLRSSASRSASTKHSHAEIVERWFEEVWNQGNTATIEELFAADGVVHGLAPQGAVVRGPEGFKVFFENMRGAFPDIHVKIEDTVVEGDKVVGRWSARMTHTGQGLGFPPTGRVVQITGISFCRVRDGQIIESWDNWDALGMMEQLGVTAAAKML
jgi:steroid delta-isomerase-like uncharacterized protein